MTGVFCFRGFKNGLSAADCSMRSGSTAHLARLRLLVPTRRARHLTSLVGLDQHIYACRVGLGIRWPLYERMSLRYWILLSTVRCAKSLHPGLVEKALQLPIHPQMVQMRQCLTHGKSHLMGVQLALKENRQSICSAQGTIMGCLQDLREPFPVVVLQLGNACGQAYKRLAMRWEH